MKESSTILLLQPWPLTSCCAGSSTAARGAYTLTTSDTATRTLPLSDHAGHASYFELGKWKPLAKRSPEWPDVIAIVQE
jgi:hypothetical protein